MDYIEKRLFGERLHLKNQRLLVATIAKQVRLADWTAEIDLQEMSDDARRNNRFCEG